MKQQSPFDVSFAPRQHRTQTAFMLPDPNADLAGMMVIGSAVHALWVPRGLAIKYSDAVGGYAPELIAALGGYWELAYDLAAVPAYFGAILLAMLVVLGKSLYPRWTVLANFGVLSLLAPLAERTSAPFGAILVGGFTNLSIAIFFLVSVASTWNPRAT